MLRGFAPLDSRGRLSLRGLCLKLRFEEFFHLPQYLRPALSLVDRLPECSASGYAVGEPRRELLHLAFRSGHFFFQQHLEIGADHLVAVGFGGFVVDFFRRALLRWTGGDARPSTAHILRNLPEDPRIRRGHAADHHGVAAGLGDDGTGVFGRTDVAIADHGNLDCLLDGGDPFPARVSAVATVSYT